MPREMQDTIGAYGRVIALPPHPLLPTPVCAHPDILCFLDGEAGLLYTFADYYRQNQALFDALPVKTVPLDLRAGDYPLDLQFDQLLYKGRLIGRPAFIPEALKRGREVVAVKQGYAKCATLALGELAVTADKGIKGAVESLGGRVLEIGNEGIALPGYDRGFIGGASAVVDETVLFFGDLLSHRQGEQIKAFLLQGGYTPVSLSHGALTDYGGLMVIDGAVGQAE